ncbi:hypothetical protein EI94DRAFT_1719985 [Lactarius quietus]|nr:hypothetical protein EI94DRAFT_1719985 [Lactarius quietus]
MNDGPKQAPFWWAELLFFFEFKVALEGLLPRNAVTRDHNSTAPFPSTSRKPSLPSKEVIFPTTATHPASRSSITSASESKHSPNTLSSLPSPGSKRRKLDGTSIDPSMMQCASYALEMMSHGGLRSHVIGALVTDGIIQLLYYDRSIILVSERVNFLDDLSRFIAMLQAMSNLPLSRLGYADVITPPPLLENPRRTADIFDGLKLTLSDGTSLLLGSTIYYQHGIIGRGTCVIRAKYIAGSGTRSDDNSWVGSLVVKLGWPAKSRISENDLIAKARNAANHDEHRWVLKHLPKVLHAEDRHITSLSRALIDRMGDRYKEHVLRIIVQDELYPITERTTAVDLAQSFREIFKCYKWLYDIPKILHRDISLNNLMLRKEGGNVYAVLNDLDLAVDVDVQSQPSKHHAGTMPFMAIDLLGRDPTVHLYYHDLESLFYVLVWITTRYHNGKEIANPPLQDWADGEGQLLLNSKLAFFMKECPEPTENFKSFKHHIFKDIWQECIQVQQAGREPHMTRSEALSRLTHFKQFLMVTYYDVYCVCTSICWIF